MIYYQSASRGRSGQPGPPQYDASTDNKANARNYNWLFWKGYIRVFTWFYQKIQHFRRWQGFSPRPNKLGLLLLMEYYCYYWHTTAATISILYQFNSTKKENEKAIKKDGIYLPWEVEKHSIFLTNLCLISCPPLCFWQSHVSLLDVQSHLGYPKNVDGRR